jgi:transketolase
MTPEELSNLEETAFRVREHIIKLSRNGGCFIGASLSCADLIVYLYKNFLNLNLNNINEPERDYLFLSKGHDVPALYGTFAELGWMKKERLKNHLKVNDYIYWHPNRYITGIEFHSGSLGHLIAVSIGVAMDCKMKGQNNKVVVIVGDGELNEGSSWEAMLVAASYQLDNLMIIVDRNQFQANMRTEDLIPLNPLDKKFEAFGLSVKSVDGHDFNALEESLSQFPFKQGKPSVLIANTLRGKGLPSIQERADRWFCNFSDREVEELIDELHGNRKANITSETLTVR